MLGYFRINDPYRLVIIFILILIFRLPYLILPDWLSIPELKWMLIGERLNANSLLYVDIWDDMSPLSAMIYKFLNYLFGRASLSLQLLGLIVFFFQIFYINFIALKHKMYNENNYLPALFYGLLGLVIFNMITLSPLLMGLTFVLFSLDNLLTHIETRNKNDGNLMNIGLFTGIAALFYMPFFLTIFIHGSILLFFTNTIKRRYLLMLYGLIIPISIIWLIYIWKGETSGFYNNYIYSLFRFDTGSLLGFKPILILTGLTLILYIVSSLKILSGFGFNIFQVRIQKTMFFSSVVTLAIWLFYTEKAGYDLIIFLPWVAFFLSHFFLSIKNKLKRELGFLVFFLSILLMYIGLTFHIFNVDAFIDLSPVVLQRKSNIQNPPPYLDKKILVLGPDIRPYFFGKPSTPYFNWNLSKSQIQNLDFYDNLEAIDRNFRRDMPEYLIDQVSITPKIFERIPLLAQEYESVGNGIYKRKSTFSN